MAGNSNATSHDERWKPVPNYNGSATEVTANHDTYEAALSAVAAALDALADTAAAQAAAHDPRADDYDPLRHHFAAGRSHGAHDALAVVSGMLADYRKTCAA